MLALPGLNAVFIATPTTLHAEYTMLAASAGKHVLVEKPRAVSRTFEALRMIEAYGRTRGRGADVGGAFA